MGVWVGRSYMEWRWVWSEIVVLGKDDRVYYPNILDLWNSFHDFIMTSIESKLPKQCLRFPGSKSWILSLSFSASGIWMDDLYQIKHVKFQFFFVRSYPFMWFSPAIRPNRNVSNISSVTNMERTTVTKSAHDTCCHGIAGYDWAVTIEAVLERFALCANPKF
jgi:hypothetical protein